VSTQTVMDGSAVGHDTSSDVTDRASAGSASADHDLVQAVVSRGDSAPSMWLFR